MKTLFPMTLPGNDWWPGEYMGIEFKAVFLFHLVSRSRKCRGPCSIPSISVTVPCSDHGLTYRSIVSTKTKLTSKSNAEKYVSSKSSPPPSTYDEPGRPFDTLLKATGCTADSTAVTCLKAVPSEVHFLLFDSTSALNHS